MKKVLFLALSLLGCLICLVVYDNKIETVPVSELDDYNYYVHDVDVSEGNVTTKNLPYRFEYYTILSIEPEINPIYKNKISFKLFNFDQSKSISNNIDEFIKIYSNELEKQSLNEEIQKIEYDGIKISTVCLYITNRQLQSLLNNKKYRQIN